MIGMRRTLAGLTVMGMVLGVVGSPAWAASAWKVSGKLEYSRMQHQYIAQVVMNGGNRHVSHLVLQFAGLTGWKIGGTTEGAQTQPAGNCGSQTTPVQLIQATKSEAAWDMGGVSHLRSCVTNLDLMPRGKHLHPFTINVYSNLAHGKVSARYKVGSVRWNGKVTHVR
jgi:hypothetical protein